MSTALRYLDWSYQPLQYWCLSCSGPISHLKPMKLLNLRWVLWMVRKTTAWQFQWARNPDPKKFSRLIQQVFIFCFLNLLSCTWIINNNFHNHESCLCFFMNHVHDYRFHEHNSWFHDSALAILRQSCESWMRNIRIINHDYIFLN